MVGGGGGASSYFRVSGERNDRELFMRKLDSKEGSKVNRGQCDLT